MKGFFSNIEAKKYINGEADYNDVRNATDRDKFIGFKKATASDSIAEEQTRDNLREGSRGLVRGTFSAIGFLADSNIFYIILYIAGVYILPFFMPYIMFYNLGNDYDTMGLVLLGGCFIFILARYIIGYMIVGTSIIMCVLIIVDKYFDISSLNNIFLTLFNWIK